MANPWAYKLDYEKAIKEDERLITKMEDPALIALMADMSTEEWEAFHWGGYSHVPFIIYEAYTRGGIDAALRRAAIFGMTKDDARACCYSFFDTYEDQYECFLGEPEDGDLKKGYTLLDKWRGFSVVTEEKRKDTIRRAKASLARHKRKLAAAGDAPAR